MIQHIFITSVSGAECIVFTNQILYIEKTTDKERALIHFTNERVSIYTIETYIEVLKKLGVS